MYKNAIFDVDGTIVDSFDGIGKCALYALEKLGRPPLPESELRKFVGPALYDSFSVVAGIEGDELKEAVKLYRDRYETHGVYECTVFGGYPELFERLIEKGVTICAASTKAYKFLVPTLEHNGLAKYFTKIVGPPAEASTSDKTEYIKAARLDENAVMIGDRKYDILSAHNAGVDVIGVTYGFAEDGEFERYKPDYIAKDTNEIYEIIMNNSRKI